MMDITLIWFPIMKGAITTLLIYGAYYFFTSNRIKIGYWYVGLLIAFWIFMPLKYDGTNSVEYREVSTGMRTSEYKDVVSKSIETHTKKLTFDEKMLIETERSQRANENIQKEIVR